jgi:predicted amidohydrolase
MNPSVAVTQLKCKLGDVEANLRRMRDLAQKARRKGLDVLCFPELVTTGYSLGQRWVDLAEPIPGPTTEKLGQIAGDLRSYLIVGMSERDSHSDRIFNSAVLIDRGGEVAGIYRKVHLWNEERRYFTPGNEFKVFSTDFGAVGIGICYDLEFPETSRILALGGAKILFFPAAEMRPFENQVETYLRSRAAENGVFVCMSNRIGREERTVFFGRSQIVSPTSRVMARAKGSPGLATARLHLETIANERKKLPYLQQRMPVVYGALQLSRACVMLYN